MSNKRESNPAGVAGAIIMIVVVIVLLTGAFYTIDAGERGVELTFGKPNMESVGEGLHFKIPIAQSVKKFEVKTQKIEVDADASSKDLQDVQTKIALNYHLKSDSVPSLYQEIGSDYKSRVIDPAIQESVKSVQAMFTAQELISKRTEVRKQIQDMLSEKLNKYYIVVDDFNIVNFQFSAEFDKAIEEKVTAEQQKLKAEMDLERIVIEKEQEITRAQAEAESLRLQKMEVTPELLTLRSIEVQSQAIEKWDGKLPMVTGGAMPFIGIDSFNSSN